MSTENNSAPAVAAASGRNQDSVQTGLGQPVYSKVVDGRTAVVLAQKERDRQQKRDASHHVTTPARRDRLQAILRASSAADADTQAARLLRALAGGPITSHEARQYLDVIHPAGRIMTLRKRGFLIYLQWVWQISACGHLHRVGEWSLMAG